MKMSNQPVQEAIEKAWREFLSSYRVSVISDAWPYCKGFKDGFKHAETIMRKALKGHPQSELWGENGLIAASMVSVEQIKILENLEDWNELRK